MPRKLSDDQLDTMRKLLESGMAGSAVAIALGCSDRAVYERRQMWRLGEESTRPKSKPTEKKVNKRTQTWHGHHFGPDLLCKHCGFTHPGSSKKWNRSNWVRCESAPEFDPELIELKLKIEQRCKEIEPATHCMTRNHEMTFENTYVTPQGRKECRACRGINNDKRKQREADKRAAMEGR